jgi:16S rRNA (guanine966-N2)-methyltransferase
MRITGGLYKNRKLNVPDGNAVRPTSDRMRQSLFNMLHHAKWANGFDLTKAHILDLFCGSGALGLEAISNGAPHATFVDLDIASIKQNSHFMDDTQFDIIKQNATKLSLQNDVQFDCIFMDPPYRKGLVTEALQNLIDKNYMADNAIVIVECEKELDLQTDLELLDKRAQGQSNLYILRYNAAI